jgi:hypothetical protein
MAIEEHLMILEKGVDAWNQWRLENPAVMPDLSRADLRQADLTARFLRGANLAGVRMTGANLSGANLSRANLFKATLVEADLSKAVFTEAILSQATLIAANLRQASFMAADLNGVTVLEADFTDSVMGFTFLGRVDLSSAKGLETIRHMGPSSVGIDTIYRSRGNVPEVFLRGAGVPEKFITYMKSLVEGGIDFYSCFISYSAKDEPFPGQLYGDLKARDLQCWLFAEDAQWGELVWGEIDDSIKRYDKLVVICSENSLQSVPVNREIERALQREDREKKNVLFPLRVDDYLLEKWDHPRKADVVSKVAGDFRAWRQKDTYSKALERLVRALSRP